jgi:hypothetical protein
MQKLFTTFLLIFSFTSYGQSGLWKPFKLAVIQPDTAVIDKSLYIGRDSIVATQLKRYYKSVDIIEKLANCIGCPRDSGENEKYKQELARLKSYEPEAKKFKYFHLLSSYSTEVYNFYFNEYEPFSTIFQLPNQKTDLVSLKILVDTSKVDYVVFYSNIHTAHKDGLPILKLTTSLYSKKDNKIILRKETEGDTNSRGDMWTCSMDVMLSCLFINGIRTSTDTVAEVLRKRQLRQK